MLPSFRRLTGKSFSSPSEQSRHRDVCGIPRHSSKNSPGRPLFLVANEGKKFCIDVCNGLCHGIARSLVHTNVMFSQCQERTAAPVRATLEESVRTPTAASAQHRRPTTVLASRRVLLPYTAAHGAATDVQPNPLAAQPTNGATLAAVLDRESAEGL